MKITKAIFEAQRSPRRGAVNPERMDLELWQWLVLNDELSAYDINEMFDGPSVFDAGLGWCFSRFGCSETALPDGRVLR